MSLEERINAFVELGEYFKNDFYINHRDVIDETILKNPWFVNSSIKSSLDYWANNLDLELLRAWLIPYQIDDIVIAKRILIIMAGNIPLVGFHDFLSVIISGNKVVIKLSSDDNVLMPLIIKKLIEIEPGIEKYVEFIDEVKCRIFDAVIATGSDNSSNYFEYYFKGLPKIIRKNRRSIAVLDGTETDGDLKGLANDVFSFFGLGCRNVSKVFLPQAYDLNKLFEVFYSYKYVLDYKKYANNYSYHKTVFLMGGNKLIDNGFLLLKEDKSFLSPTSMLYYEFYTDMKVVEDFIVSNKERLQCIVSKSETSFGCSQKPNLWDYADGVDSIEFLKNI